MLLKLFGGYENYNGYDDGYGDEYGDGDSSGGIVASLGGMTTIILIIIACCCCSICAYSLRNKCMDDDSWIKWINDTWWVWILSIIFPPLLVVKIILWVTCSMLS